MAKNQNYDSSKDEDSGVFEDAQQQRITQFHLLYKKGSQPATIGIIEASSLERAVVLGRDWCTRNMVRYINVRDPILMREDEHPELFESEGNKQVQ